MNSQDIFQDLKDDLVKKFNKSLDATFKIAQRIPSDKSTIINELTELETNIVNLKLEDFSVSKLVRKLNKEIDPDVILGISLESFLSVVRHTVKFKRNYKEVNKMFKEYYDSLDEKLIESYKDLGEDAFDKEKTKQYGIGRKKYDEKKEELQIELLKLQEWVIKNNKRVCILFEGRDAAGKGGTIKRFAERLMPKGQRIVALGIPTDDESNNWLPRYEKQLPKKGEIVFFDRSWYNRAVVEPTMGYCTEKQYIDFMENVDDWETNLIENEDIILIKFWLSIKPETQLDRFEERQQSPLKYWKFTKNDLQAQSKWDVMTSYKDQMFEKTSTTISPWVMINSNDKRLARLNAMKYVLNNIDYDNKNDKMNLKPSKTLLTRI